MLVRLSVVSRVVGDLVLVPNWVMVLGRVPMVLTRLVSAMLPTLLKTLWLYDGLWLAALWLLVAIIRKFRLVYYRFL